MSVREDLKAYLDGELTADRAAEVQRQLAADSTLQRELEEIRTLGAAFAGARAPSPVGLERTLGALASAKSRQKRFRLTWTVVSALGACAAVVFGVLLASGRLSEDSSDNVMAFKSEIAMGAKATEEVPAASEADSAAAGSVPSAAKVVRPRARDGSTVAQKASPSLSLPHTNNYVVQAEPRNNARSHRTEISRAPRASVTISSSGTVVPARSAGDLPARSAEVPPNVATLLPASNQPIVVAVASPVDAERSVASIAGSVLGRVIADAKTERARIQDSASTPDSQTTSSLRTAVPSPDEADLTIEVPEGAQDAVTARIEALQSSPAVDGAQGQRDFMQNNVKAAPGEPAAGLKQQKNAAGASGSFGQGGGGGFGGGSFGGGLAGGLPGGRSQTQGTRTLANGRTTQQASTKSQVVNQRGAAQAGSLQFRAGDGRQAQTAKQPSLDQLKSQTATSNGLPSGAVQKPTRMVRIQIRLIKTPAPKPVP